MKIHVETSDNGNRVDTAFQEDSGEIHWAINLRMEPNGRAFYTVTHDGWVVYEVTAREVRINERGTTATECFACGKMRKRIPDHVLSHIPRVQNPTRVCGVHDQELEPGKHCPACVPAMSVD